MNLIKAILSVTKSKTERYIIEDIEYVPIKAYELYLKQIALQLISLSKKDVITQKELLEVAQEILKNIET